jgi:SAM-dependent methyltransferase
VDHEEAGRYWEVNAQAWTRLARAGYDVYRDGFNIPAFFEMLPEVDGLAGLDLGCGEEHNTRLVARRGARVTGIDISPTFVRHAREAEEELPLGIRYRVASALDLPFEDAGFDFTTAFMSLMDMPETREGLRPFRVPRFTHTTSEWLNLLVDGGFVLERLGEPRPSDEKVREHPWLQNARVAPYFLHVRARKPPR